MLIADIFVLDLGTIRLSWMWDGFGLLALILIFFTPHKGTAMHLLLPLFVRVLCISAMGSLGLRRFFANRWIAVIGGMCYSVYLLHFVFIAAISKLTRGAILYQADFVSNLPIQLIVTGIPSLVLCVIFFVLVERPCMDPSWPSKIRDRFSAKRIRETAA